MQNEKWLHSITGKPDVLLRAVLQGSVAIFILKMVGGGNCDRSDILSLKLYSIFQCLLQH